LCRTHRRTDDPRSGHQAARFRSSGVGHGADHRRSLEHL